LHKLLVIKLSTLLKPSLRTGESKWLIVNTYISVEDNNFVKFNKAMLNLMKLLPVTEI
jgi:uncharacterized protein YjfI (DUF2170 family)